MDLGWDVEIRERWNASGRNRNCSECIEWARSSVLPFAKLTEDAMKNRTLNAALIATSILCGCLVVVPLSELSRAQTAPPPAASETPQ